MEHDVGHPLALFVLGVAFPIMFQGIAHEAVIGNMIGKGGFAWGIVGWIFSALWATTQALSREVPTVCQ